ncbi:MAG: B3/4 domain-containing protein [Patescibacteria group bacterium]
MTFKVDSRIFEKFPDVRIGYIFVTGIDNSQPENNNLIKRITEESQKIRKELSIDTVSALPYVSRWRAIYKEFGAKPSDYRSSIENLTRMILKGRDLSHINTLVDIYNYISLKYKLPIGGEDVDKMQGNLELSIATGEEPITELLGDNNPERPFKGEILYKDEAGVICRCWNWREAARTILSKKTRNAVLVVETTSKEEYELLEKAIDGMAALVTHFVGGKLVRGYLTSNSPLVTFNEPK